MAALALFDAAGQWQDTLLCEHRIAPWLQGLGVSWGVLHLGPAPEPDAPGAQAWLLAQQALLARLGQGLGLHHIDRVRVTPGQPGWPALRQQFTQEHRHSEAELRVFLAGAGLFTVRHPEGFVGLLCEAGDWVALPTVSMPGPSPTLTRCACWARPKAGWPSPAACSAPSCLTLTPLSASCWSRPATPALTIWSAEARALRKAGLAD